MKIEFTKMQGLGNDFMVIDGIHQSVSLSKNMIIQWSDRHYGVGFDQLLLLEAPSDETTDFQYRIFNRDGTEVFQCGNGARCIAKFALLQGIVTSHFMKAKTGRSLLELQVEENGEVTVNMGIVQLEPHLMPFKAVYAETYVFKDLPETLFKKGEIAFQALFLGNPHVVIWCEGDEGYDYEKIGYFFNQHPAFPEGINVSFAALLDPFHLQLHVYERGTGLTFACGSAACASVVAGILAKKLQTRVKVSQPGGNLLISWQGENQSVYMTGPAETVFEGKISL